MGAEYRPFLGQEAVRRGTLSARQLQKDYRAIYRNVYVPRSASITALTRARAAWLWSQGQATLVGLSAAAVLGSKWIDGDLPAELTRADRHNPRGIVVHTYHLLPDECCVVDGMRLTTPARTAFDLGRTITDDHAVIRLDALAGATNMKAIDVLTIADKRPGAEVSVTCVKCCAMWTAALNLRRRPESDFCSFAPVCQSPRPRSSSSTSTELHASGWTWVGGNGRSRSSTTVFSTGRTDANGHGTSTELPSWKPRAGSSSDQRRVAVTPGDSHRAGTSSVAGCRMPDLALECVVCRRGFSHFAFRCHTLGDREVTDVR